MSQHRSGGAKYKTLVIVNSAIALYALVAALLYAAFGHSVVAAAYRGESLAVFNQVISGQAQFPVEYYYGLADGVFVRLLYASVVACLVLESVVLSLRRWRDAFREPAWECPRPGWSLFLVSFLVLFGELAAIRWFPAYVVYLTFFTNFVLIAAFVGTSIGCLAARRSGNLILFVPLILLAATSAAVLVYWGVGHAKAVVLTVGSVSDPEHVYFGTLAQAASIGTNLAVPMEAVIAVFFGLIALLFVGLGQQLGRDLARIDDRIMAYMINIGGSLAGIVVFTVLSYGALAPVWWFLIFFGCLLRLLNADRLREAPSVITGGTCLLVIAGAEWVLHPADVVSHWSPYYNIRYNKSTGDITVNTIGHQAMADRSVGGVAYSLPYLLRTNAGGRPIENVLIIGAGSGNDVAHALWHGVRQVDAVEVDPIIAGIGRRDHPNHPYSDDAVKLTIVDGRHFLKTTDEQYDLIVYALVDSLTLHSCYSSVRLESFLFTEQAFGDIRDRLRPDGLFVAYNYYRKGWVISRLRDLLAKTFGREPLVIGLPPRDVIHDSDQDASMTMLIAGNTDQIERRFQDAGGFVLDTANPAANLDRNGFEAESSNDLERLQLTRVETSRSYRTPTDDWPFIYLKDAVIPVHNIWGLTIILALSTALFVVFVPVRSTSLSTHFFFLGAGFMLIETNSVIRFALLFGSTWLVNAVVFFAILTMILLANLYVLRRPPAKLRWVYAALGASLVLNVLIGLEAFVGAAPALRAAVSCVLVFLPVFFAGVIFASSFRRSRQPDSDLGANIAGVVFGGILEYVALVVGYQLVLLIVLGLYGLSLIGLRRLHRPAAG